MVKTKLVEELHRIAGDGKGGFIITHGSEMQIECLVVFIESLLEEQKKELLDLVEKEVGKLYEPYEGEEQIMIEHHMLDKVSTIINQLRV